MQSRWPIPLQRGAMFWTRVALIGLEAPQRIVVCVLAHHSVSRNFCQYRCGRDRQHRSISLYLCNHLRNMRRHKIPSTIYHCGCLAHINLFRQTFYRPFGGQSLGSIHAQRIAFGVSHVANRPCCTRCGHMIKHFFAFNFRQLFRVARTTHQRRCIVTCNHVARQHSSPDHQWSGPCTFSHFINTDHN